MNSKKWDAANVLIQGTESSDRTNGKSCMLLSELQMLTLRIGATHVGWWHEPVLLAHTHALSQETKECRYHMLHNVM